MLPSSLSLIITMGICTAERRQTSATLRDQVIADHRSLWRGDGKKKVKAEDSDTQKQQHRGHFISKSPCSRYALGYSIEL